MEGDVFNSHGLVVELHYFPVVPGVVASGPAVVVSLESEEDEEGVFVGVFGLVEADDEFAIIFGGVELLDLSEQAVLDVPVDDLVFLGPDVVNDEVLAGVVQDLLIAQGN